MGGPLTAQSEVGKGSVFILDLPMKALAPAPAWPRLAGESAVLDVAGPATRSALQRYLPAAGFVAGRPANGGAGLHRSPVPAALRSATARPVRRSSASANTARRPRRRWPTPGLADLVLIQPLRRRDLVAALRQLAAGAPLSEALADRAPAPRATPCPASPAAGCWWPTTARSTARWRWRRCRGSGCQVTLVTDGREAVDAATSETVRPDADGRQHAGSWTAMRPPAEIRRRDADRRARPGPIVALTAHVVGLRRRPLARGGHGRGAPQAVHPRRPRRHARRVPRPCRAAAPVAAALPTAPPCPSRSTATLGPASASDLLDPQVTGELARLAAAGKGDFVARVRRLYRENAPGRGPRCDRGLPTPATAPPPPAPPTR